MWALSALCSPPKLDPIAALPEARVLRQAAKAGDWPALDAGFTQFVDPNEHALAVRIAGLAAHRCFLEWTWDDNPTSALAGTLLAWRLVEDGWKIRSTQWARNVSARQWRGFHEHLNQAERILHEVTTQHPEYTSAQLERLHAARGLGLGQAEARRRHASLDQVSPHFYPAQSAMIQQLCPKWGGSYDAMHRFALKCAKASPPGSLNAAVIAEAHIEQWLMVNRDAGWPVVGSHLRRPEVLRELREAAKHSVLHPAFRRTVGWVRAHSSFAMAFSLANDHRAAAPHFAALYANGNLADKVPWMYLRDWRIQFMFHRQWALR